jgi:hypothetical protein
MKNKILLLMIGIMVGMVMYLPKAEAATPSVTTTTNNQAVDSAFHSKSTDLRLQLNSLLREHTALAAVTLTALYQGADTTHFMQLMNTNQEQLTAVVSKVYGQKTANEFSKLWAQHMTEYQNYTLAKKNHDTAKMNQAKKNLQTISDKLGKLFDNGSTHLSTSTVSGLMQDHITGTLAVVDSVAARNTTGTADAIKNGYDQAGKFADVLAQGMILDKPNLFTQSQ